MLDENKYLEYYFCVKPMAHQLRNNSHESKVEDAKRASRALRGTIAESLQADTDVLAKDDRELAKFHGIYSQEDRDAREAAKIGGERKHIFMVRVKISAGVLSSDQYLALDRLAEEVVHDHTLRVTTRQNIQLHGVLKGDLRRTIRRVNDALLTTLCGCGDVERNIVAPPAPFDDVGHHELRRLAHELTRAMTPATRAYHEIWLDGERLESSCETEPFYGPQYLPRKFKTGLALPDDDSVEVYTQDLGLIGIVEGGVLARLDVLVGGSAGMTHRNSATYARLGTPLGSVNAVHAVEIVRAVASLFRDYGDRTDRKHARLKYVVEEWGIDAFRTEVERRLGFALDAWIPIAPLQTPELLGPHAQGDGRHFYGVHIDNGRIGDAGTTRLKSALRHAIATLRPRVLLTPSQNVLLADLDPAQIEALGHVLRAYRIDPLPAGARRRAMACPALPTCGLALAEAERISGRLLDAFDRELERLGTDDAPPMIRITGCPNGCVRTYNSEIGIVGRKPGHYDVFVGGDGERLAELYAEQVELDAIITVLRPLLSAWVSERRPRESLTQFYRRRHASRARTDILTGAKVTPAVERLRAAALSAA